MKLRQLREGAASLGTWWLKGFPPVTKDHAQQRTRVCLQCPMNLPETLFEKPRRALARQVKAAFEAKHRMNLELPDEALLEVCEACGCELRLKVWQPAAAIFHNGKPSYFDQLHSECWVRGEFNQLK